VSPNPRSVVAPASTLRVAVESADFGDLPQCLQLAPLAEADVCIWDLPPTDVRLSEVSRQLPVLVLLAEPGVAQAALDAGARAVLLRDQFGEGELLSALMSVHAGLTVIDSRLTDTLFPGRRLSPPHDVAPFTAREEQVASLLVEGMSNKLIARELEISEHTAKFHVNRILVKLDADTRTEAVVRALRYGMLEL
jgi:two-component system nitrate/nitrite response regulator NarL